MIIDKIRRFNLKKHKINPFKKLKMIKAPKHKTLIAFAVLLAISTASIFNFGVADVFYGYAVKELPIYSVERKDRVLALTFDCAWGTDYTQKMLDVFDFYNIKVTYFTVQFWAEKNSEYLKAISDKGHTIGTHSKTHGYMSKMPRSKVIEELQSSAAAIEGITGKRPTLFRAPYGDYNNNVILTAKEQGFYTIQWDVDSLDWKDISQQEIAGRVLKNVKSGSIILFHNNGTNTLSALEIIIPALLNSGYSFLTVDNLIYTQDYYIRNDGRQFKN